MKKIGFSGIKGCGKTTLLNEVKKILSLKSNTQLTSKSDINNPFDEDKKLSFNSQFFNFTQCINQENLLFDTSSGFLLCDTTILDYYLQWQQSFSEKEKTPALEERDELLRYLFKFWIPTYDVLFFIIRGTDTALVAIVPALANRGLLEVELENARRRILEIMG